MTGINLIILIYAGLTVTAVFTSFLATRAGAPLLLLFLGIGLMAGREGADLIETVDVHGAFLIGSAALAIILFDSGFGTRIKSYRQASAPAITLATLGVLLTTAVVALFTHWFLHLTWTEALLLGAVLSPTDAAAVFFLLRVGGITIRDRVRSTLEIESGTNDPMAILLALSLIEFVAPDAAPPGGGVWSLLSHFVVGIGAGTAVGLAGGLAIVMVVNRIRLELGLYPVVVMGLALLVFSLSNLVGGSGFLSAYLAGLIVGNTRLQPGGSIRRFLDGITWLAQITMFVTLGLMAKPSLLNHVTVPGLIVAAILTFLARPLAVYLCLTPFGFGWRDRLFVSWVGLRGAVSILLALQPSIEGVSLSGNMFDLSFVVVVISLVMQGWTIRPLARWLGLIVPKRGGPVERVEVDLPGIADRSLVAYDLTTDMPVNLGRSLPRWARPLLLSRQGRTMVLPRQFLSGDRVYLLAVPSQVKLLDSLFGRSRVDVKGTESCLMGDFTVAPDVILDELCKTYGLPQDSRNRGMMLGELFYREFRADLEVGDRLNLGPIDLIVNEMSDGNIRSVGIALDPSARPAAGWERFLTRFQGPLSGLLGTG